MKHDERVATVEEVAREFEGDASAVETYISYLRRKLAIAGIDPVETVRGVGYRYAPRRLQRRP